MKKIFSLTLVFLLALTTFSAVLGEGVEEFLNGTESGSQKFFIKLKNISFINSDNYLADLKNQAEISQKEFLDFLKSERAHNNVKTFWSFNAVSIEADAQLISKIAERNDVEKIFFVPEAELFTSTKPSVFARTTDGDGLVYALKTMNVDRAWKDFNIKGRNVKTGVIDTGINHNLAVFNGKIIDRKNFAGVSTATEDTNGHGTHVAGTVLGGEVDDDLYSLVWGMWWNKVGTFNGKIGVAPEAMLYFAKCMDDDGKISFDDVITGLEWMADPDGNPYTKDGARVINASLGASVSIPELREPLANIQKTGTMLVFAAGNSGNKVGSPADFPEIFAIGAVNNNDAKASFSSIGPASWDGVDYIKPEVMAPGVSVISYYGEKLAGIDGTSMASPNATGVIALLLEADPSLTIEKIKSVLKETALDLGTAGPDNQYGHGRIDAYAALAKVTGKNVFKSMIYQYDSYRNAIMERSRTLDGKYESEMAYIQLVTRKDELKESIVEYMNNNNVYQIMAELAEENIDLTELF